MTDLYYFEQDAAVWNRAVRESACSHLMQTWEWGEYKTCLGWRAFRIMLRTEDGPKAGAQILFKSIPLTLFSIGYIPKGPLIHETDSGWDRLFPAMHALARKNRAVVIRMEPAYPNTSVCRDRISGLGFRCTAQTNQPRCTFVVDLSHGKEAVFERFSRNTRRLIRKAETEGVTVFEGNAGDIGVFYRQLADTSRRKRLPMQSQCFYSEAFRVFESVDAVRLFLAKVNGEIVSSLLVFFHEGQSMHLWAGNSAPGLKSNASHLLHWTAMQTAIKKGCLSCDLWGIPDEIADMQERGEEISSRRGDGLWGVYRFKEGFGGAIQCFAGTWDLVIRPAGYRLMQWLTGGQETVDRISSLIHRF
ncbi:peptidoglycan bridge formation glycyltransferase FemA/FemB family protein [bacterium]|nr:peptidoglycan bridge formation glycyltransferase FemA/FemB family protein [bacterium]